MWKNDHMDTPADTTDGLAGPASTASGSAVPDVREYDQDVEQPAAAPPRPVEVYLPPTGYRLDQLVASFLASADFSPNTADAYRGDLRLFLRWCTERALDPLTLGMPEIQVFGKAMQTTPSERTGKVRTERTVARILNAISSFYTYLGNAGAMHYHPAAKAARPKYDRRYSNTRSLTEPQARGMCVLAPTAAPGPWPRLCAQLTMHLMVDLGARVTEICNLDVDDIGYRADSSGAEFRVITLRMKGNKIRVRPIPVPLAPLLDAWLAQRIADPGETALLVDRDGARITRYQVDYLVTTLAAAAGVPDPQQITPHSTRHAFNTLAKARGASLEQRQHALAHASADTTALYDHTNDSLASDPAHLVAAATFTPPASSTSSSPMSNND